MFGFEMSILAVPSCIDKITQASFAKRLYFIQRAKFKIWHGPGSDNFIAFSYRVIIFSRVAARSWLPTTHRTTKTRLWRVTVAPCSGNRD